MIDKEYIIEYLNKALNDSNNSGPEHDAYYVLYDRVIRLMLELEKN